MTGGLTVTAELVLTNSRYDRVATLRKAPSYRRDPCVVWAIGSTFQRPGVRALGTRPYTDEASSSPLMLTRGFAAVTSSLRTSASSSAEPKAGASSCDRRGRVHADRRTFAGHPDSAVDRRDLRQGRGRKRGDTARSGWSLTDDLTRSTRTYPQVTADRTRGNTRRIAVSLACKQGVRGSSPPAGSASLPRNLALDLRKCWVEDDCRQVLAVPGRPRGAAPFPAALPAAHEQVRTLRLDPCSDSCDETARSVVRLVLGSRMEGMIFHVVGQGFVCQRGDLRWNLTERGPRGFGTTPTGASPLKRQKSAIPIPSGNTIVAVPDGQLGRRLIGVEYLRQGWGRNCTDTARGSRTASDQPTRGPLTRAHCGGTNRHLATRAG